MKRSPANCVPTHSRFQGRAALRLSPVAAAAATLLAGFLPAYAQQAAAPAADTPPAQTVVITGIRRSIETSIAIKRNSDQIVDAITAEDIGKMPDISIAESLSRLPGVAAQRVDGRAQVIAIRGMSPDFAGTLLNGREQTTTGVNRGVEFDQYPAELMSAAVVYKTPDATLLGQGVSGTVDLRVVRPLEVGDRKVALNARAEHNSLGALNGSYGGTGANGGRLSASYVDQFADRTVGLALGLAHLDAPGQELHYKAWGFQDDSNCLAHTADWGCSPVKNLPAGANYINGFEVEALSRRDQRDGFMGVLEYKPNKNLHSTLDLYYSTFKQTEVMRGLMGSIGDGWSGVNSGSTFSNVGTTNVGGINLVTSGTTAGGPPMVVRNDYNTRSDKLSSLGWNTEATFGGIKAIADLSYSNAKRDETLFETYAGAPMASMAFSIPTGEGFPTFTPSTNFADPSQVLLSDPAGWGHDGRKQYSGLDDTIKAITLHAKKDLDGPISRIDAGINYSQRDKTRNFLVFFAGLKNGGNTQALAAGQAMTPTSLGFAGIPGVLSYDVNQIASQYYTMTQNMSGGPTGDFSRDYGVHERITTGFVKADIATELGGMPLSGNMGVQLIHTNQYSNAFAFAPNGTPLGQITPGTSYNDFLPSLNLVGDIGSDRKLRLGLARTLTRPRIDDLNASSSASVASTGAPVWSGSGGNPRLQPWRANSLDLSFEQYLSKRSMVSAAVFYKQLVTYIYPTTITNYDFTGYVNGNPNPVTPISNFGQYSSKANGQGGNMRGIELNAVLDGALLTPALDGFGAQVTTSFTNSSIQVNGPGGATPLWTTLPGLSKTVAGLTVFYEKYGFSIRVADRYRSDYRGEYVSLFGATSVYRTPAQNQVDFQTSYEFQQGSMKGLSVLFQIVNVTNSPDRTLQDGSGFGGVTAPQENNKYGRSYLFGVNYKL